MRRRPSPKLSARVAGAARSCSSSETWAPVRRAFTQGLARGLGVEGYVHSPTFVLAAEHVGRLRLRHVDLYRIDGAEETLDLGLDEFGAGDLVGVVGVGRPRLRRLS